MQPVVPDNPAIVLASGSPRRRELCRRVGFEPVVRVSSIPEQRESGESPEKYARRLANEKARDVAADLEGDSELPGWMLSADTIVVHRQEVLEKPEDREGAEAMLARLSGSRHEVVTAFCWYWRAPGGDEEVVERVEAVRTDVWLRELDDEMIERYVATGEPMDKAGGYGIQDVGSVLVRRIRGSHYCVVGLPVCEVVETLQQMGGLRDYPFGTGRDSE